MDDMLGKMGELLSDPESLQQLQKLAQMLRQQEDDGTERSSSDTASDAASSAEESSSGGFDMGMLLKVQELMGAMHRNDEDTQLLMALRPHLKTDRQKKVDQAVKLLKLYAVFSAVKENGLLQDLL